MINPSHPTIAPLASTDDAAVVHAILEMHSAAVVIHGEEEIARYLKETSVADVFASLCQKAREEFPLPTELYLAISRDPEVNEKHLTLNIRPIQYPDDFVERIEAFSARQEKLLAECGHHVLVTTDFREPGEIHGIQVG